MNLFGKSSDSFSMVTVVKKRDEDQEIRARKTEIQKEMPVKSNADVVITCANQGIKAERAGF
jgi:hypothetical protein